MLTGDDASYEPHSSTARLCLVQYQTSIIYAFWRFVCVCVGVCVLVRARFIFDICSAAKPKKVYVGRPAERKILVFPLRFRQEILNRKWAISGRNFRFHDRKRSSVRIDLILREHQFCTTCVQTKFLSTVAIHTSI